MAKSLIFDRSDAILDRGIVLGPLVQVVAASSVATPTTGYATVFIDSANANKLSFKDSAGVVHVITHT